MFIRQRTVWQTLVSTIGQEAATSFTSHVTHVSSVLARIDVGGYIEIDILQAQNGVRVTCRRNRDYRGDTDERLSEIAGKMVEQGALLAINDEGWQRR